MDKNKRLLIKPDYTKEEYIQVSPVSAGWEFIKFFGSQIVFWKILV